MRKLINVTANDIKRAIAHRAKNTDNSGIWSGDYHYCPVALASKRVFKKQFKAITDTFLCLTDSKDYLLPQVAREFILAFDSTLYSEKAKVKPFQFYIEVNL